MNILILTVKTEDNGVTAEYVNHVERLLTKANIINNSNEFMKIDYWCICDNDEGLSPYVKTKQLITRDDVTDSNWYNLDIFNIEPYFPELYKDEEDHEPAIRVVNLTNNILPLGNSQFAFMKAFPHSHARFIEDYDISDDEYFYLKDHKCEFIKLAENWDNVEVDATEFNSGFSIHDAGKLNKFIDTFNADPSGVMEKYGSNVQQFIEDIINDDPLIFSFTTPTGSIGPYYFDNESQNEHLNSVFDEAVRPRLDQLLSDHPTANIPGMSNNFAESKAAPYINDGHDAFHTLVQFVEVRDMNDKSFRDDRFLDINVL